MEEAAHATQDERQKLRRTSSERLRQIEQGHFADLKLDFPPGSVAVAFGGHTERGTVASPPEQGRFNLRIQAAARSILSRERQRRQSPRGVHSPRGEEVRSSKGTNGVAGNGGTRSTRSPLARVLLRGVLTKSGPDSDREREAASPGADSPYHDAREARALEVEEASPETASPTHYDFDSDSSSNHSGFPADYLPSSSDDDDTDIGANDAFGASLTDSDLQFAGSRLAWNLIRRRQRRMVRRGGAATETQSDFDSLSNSESFESSFDDDSTGQSPGRVGLTTTRSTSPPTEHRSPGLEPDHASMQSPGDCEASDRSASSVSIEFTPRAFSASRRGSWHATSSLPNSDGRDSPFFDFDREEVTSANVWEDAAIETTPRASAHSPKRKNGTEAARDHRAAPKPLHLKGILASRLRGKPTTLTPSHVFKVFRSRYHDTESGATVQSAKVIASTPDATPTVSFTAAQVTPSSSKSAAKRLKGQHASPKGGQAPLYTSPATKPLADKIQRRRVKLRLLREKLEKAKVIFAEKMVDDKIAAAALAEATRKRNVTHKALVEAEQ